MLKLVSEHLLNFLSCKECVCVCGGGGGAYLKVGATL